MQKLICLQALSGNQKDICQVNCSATHEHQADPKAFTLSHSPSRAKPPLPRKATTLRQKYEEK